MKPYLLMVWYKSQIERLCLNLKRNYMKLEGFVDAYGKDEYDLGRRDWVGADHLLYLIENLIDDEGIHQIIITKL